MRRFVLCLGIVLIIGLSSTGIGLVVRYGNEIPNSLTVDEQINPQTGQRYTPTEISEQISKKRNESMEFRLTLVGAGIFGLSITLIGLCSIFLVCFRDRILEFDPFPNNSQQVAPMPQQALPLDSTNPLQKNSPTTTDAQPPTSSPSPLVTFRVHELAPPLGQMSLV